SPSRARMINAAKFSISTLRLVVKTVSVVKSQVKQKRLPRPVISVLSLRIGLALSTVKGGAAILGVSREIQCFLQIRNFGDGQGWFLLPELYRSSLTL